MSMSRLTLFLLMTSCFFRRGDVSSIQAINILFKEYDDSLGKHINPSKSILYVGSLTPQKHSFLANLRGFIVGSFPFVYLGVPIFKDKSKHIYFQSSIDKINIKLAT